MFSRSTWSLDIRCTDALRKNIHNVNRRVPPLSVTIFTRNAQEKPVRCCPALFDRTIISIFQSGKFSPLFSFLSVTIVSHISYRKIAATSHACVAMFCYSSKNIWIEKYLEECLFLKTKKKDAFRLENYK